MAGCGLVAGWDRLHSRLHARTPVEALRIGRRLGLVTLHATHRFGHVAVADWSQAGIGYTPVVNAHRSIAGCGLVAGWDRLHSCSWRLTIHAGVADWSQAGIGYTGCHACTRGTASVADWSQAGIGYTRSALYSSPPDELRIGRRLGLVTLETLLTELST